MKSFASCIAVLSATLLFPSCSGNSSNIESISLGTCSYHEGFLWTDPDTCFLEKTLHLEFNDDALVSNASIDMVFTDNNGKTVPPKSLQIVYEGKTSKNNVVKVTSQGKEEREVDIKFRFLPGSGYGKHQGYIAIRPHGMDAVNDIEVSNGTQVMQWTIYFDHTMNPLKKGLIIAFVVFVAAVVLARLILHRRTFGSTAKKSITVTDSSGNVIYGPKTTHFGGASEIVFADSKIEQNLLNRFFFGRTVTVVSSAFSSQLRLTPGKRKEIKLAGGGYTFSKMKIKYSDTPLCATNNDSKSKVNFS